MLFKSLAHTVAFVLFIFTSVLHANLTHHLRRLSFHMFKLLYKLGRAKRFQFVNSVII